MDMRQTKINNNSQASKQTIKQTTQNENKNENNAEKLKRFADSIHECDE